MDAMYPYHLDGDFILSDHLMLSSAFELGFSSDVVRTVFEFHVKGAASDGGGTSLRPARALATTAPRVPEDSC